MNQRDWMQQFDAAAFAAFLDTGLADRARYYAPSTTAGIDCTVLVDRDVRDYGDDLAPVSTSYVRISLRRDEVDADKLARVALLDAAGTEVEWFRLAAALAETDESLTHWVAEVANA